MIATEGKKNFPYKNILHRVTQQLFQRETNQIDISGEKFHQLSSCQQSTFSLLIKSSGGLKTAKFSVQARTAVAKSRITREKLSNNYMSNIDL